MKYLERFFKLLIIAMLLFFSTSPPLTALAVEDSILGVSIDKFNGVISSRSALEVTKDEYKPSAGNPGYAQKLKVDTLHYKLEILKIADELGNNYTPLIPEHIKAFNSLLIPSLTDTYQIKATINEEDGTYTIESNKESTKTEITKIIGSPDDSDEDMDADSTIWAQLNNLAKATEAYADNNEGLKEYYSENISTIRYLMTSIKDIYTNFSSEMVLGDELKEKFVEVYDAIATFALENDLQALANLNLFGDTIGFELTTDGQEIVNYVAEWNEEITEERLNKWASGKEIDSGLPVEMFGEYREYMLKNIAASSTFKPFETNLNTMQPFTFLGDESKVFHEMVGTKRKLLLTPQEGDNTLNIGTNMEMVQNLKFMTLRDFVDNRDGNKIIYVDNLQYSLSDIEKAQDITSGDIQDVEGEGTGNEALDGIAETTQDELGNTNRGWLASAWNWVKKGLVNNLRGSSLIDGQEGSPSLVWKYYNKAANQFSDGKSVSTILFIKGDVEDIFNIEEHVDAYKKNIVMSNLIYNNIMEEYWTYGSKLKLSKDMDKPLFVDIYGNIVTASGIVVIPAMTNPFVSTKTHGNLLFTRAFIESYPTYTVKNGDLKVKHSDRNKLALFGYPMTDEEIEADIKKTEFDYKADLVGDGPSDEDSEDNEDTEDVPEVQNEETVQPDSDDEENEQGEISNTLTTAFVEQEIDYIPGVKFYVGNAETGELGQYKTATKNLQPIAYKFNNNYERVKSLDLFAFARKKDGSLIDSYYSLRDSLGQVSGVNRALLINEYTVKLSFDEGDSQTITFKDFPDSNEIKRYMYLVNLEHIAKVDEGVLVEKNQFSSVARITTTEALFKGVADTALLNSLVPEYIETMFDMMRNLSIEKANDRYNSALKGDVSNNIVYIKNIEEIESIKGILPTVYKAILLVSIVLIIFNIIMYAISNDSRFSRIGKVFIILYVVTFLFIVMPKSFTTLINSPMKHLFRDELMHWTLIEQEKASNSSLVENNGEVKVAEDTYSSSLKLYEVKYTSPFSIFRRDDYMDIDQFYSLYVNNDEVFESQSTPMYMDGKFLTIDTETIFESSSVIVEDVKDPLMKVRHDIYGKPEFAYYLPYYQIVDNLVYNLNTITDVTKKVPRDIVYSNGDRKTGGRVSDWINSSLFLDYEEFLKRVASYEAGDKISAELALADVEDMIAKYGDPSDFLGLGKILGQPTVLTLTDPNHESEDSQDTSVDTNTNSNPDIVVGQEISEEDSALQPFTREGLEKLKATGWYPNNFDKAKNPYYKELFTEKIKKVNDKTKKFMLELGDISRYTADENLIKTIALYASIEFNKEFNSFAANKGPTGIELNNFPIERLMMSLTLPREDLIDNSITTYPNQLMNNTGYLGLTLGTFNDFLLIFINSIKPIMIVGMWAIIGLVIFIKKIILPDHTNSSIMGSIKLLILFILTTFLYSLCLVATIKIVNLTGWSLSGVLLSLVANLAYAIGLMYIAYVMLRDLWNLGSSITLGVLDNAFKKFKMSFRNAVSLVPFADRLVPGLNDTGGAVKHPKDRNNLRRPIDYPINLPTNREIPQQIRDNSPRDGVINDVRVSRSTSDSLNDSGEYYISPNLTELNKTGNVSKPITVESVNRSNVDLRNNSQPRNPVNFDTRLDNQNQSLNDSSLHGASARVNSNTRNAPKPVTETQSSSTTSADTPQRKPVNTEGRTENLNK